MKTKPRSVTDSYDYANKEQEFVVCHKNRPFAILVSPRRKSQYVLFLEGVRVMNFRKKHENPFNVLGHYLKIPPLVWKE